MNLENCKIYNSMVVVVTLDSMPKQCCVIFTDGEETQEQINFHRRCYSILALYLSCHQGQALKGDWVTSGSEI